MAPLLLINHTRIKFVKSKSIKNEFPIFLVINPNLVNKQTYFFFKFYEYSFDTILLSKHPNILSLILYSRRSVDFPEVHMNGEYNFWIKKKRRMRRRRISNHLEDYIRHFGIIHIQICLV